ncbi:hypothetical protein MTO96_031721 [Rhipicephalus appendiculatus]
MKSDVSSKERSIPMNWEFRNPERRPGKDRVVLMASSRKGLQRLEDFIEQGDELRAKVKTRQPKGKSLEVKVIGIDEDLGNEEISRKIIEQNGLNCTDEGRDPLCPPEKALHDVSRSGTPSPTRAVTPVVPDASGFSLEGDDIIGRLQALAEGAALSVSAGPAQTSGEEDDDAVTSVSGTTAVAAGLLADVGGRVQRRVREIEDEVSRFLSDSSNKVPVSALTPADLRALPESLPAGCGHWTCPAGADNLGITLDLVPNGPSGDDPKICGPLMLAACSEGLEAQSTTSTNEEEDAGSSVFEATAVGIRLRADLGTRIQARAREFEDEVSRCCADSANRIMVSARNYIMTRVFELVSLCSDMRADTATERGAALAL